MFCFGGSRRQKKGCHGNFLLFSFAPNHTHALFGSSSSCFFFFSDGDEFGESFIPHITVGACRNSIFLFFLPFLAKKSFQSSKDSLNQGLDGAGRSVQYTTQMEFSLTCLIPLGPE